MIQEVNQVAGDSIVSDTIFNILGNAAGWIPILLVDRVTKFAPKILS